MKLNALTLIDFYKSGHKFQYTPGTTKVYSNFTPRSSHHFQIPDVKEVLFFGLQGKLMWLVKELWDETFFNLPKQEVVAEYKRRMDTSLGEGAVPVDHIAALHDLGYLPLCIKALPEGSLVSLKVPVFTITNTHPDFFWLTNYFEDMLSAESWKSINNATIAYQYRKLFNKFAEFTGSPAWFTDWQGHDFSMRGMSGVHDAASTGASHLISFLGTDTIPAMDYLDTYYGGRDTFLGGSVPATEHSVMCIDGNTDEIGTFRRLITEVYPSGIVSIVSDTWDFWKVITEYAEILKPEILARTVNPLGQAKVVFRPDSGNPADIICGDVREPTGSPAFKGAVECLWDIFGGTINEKGYKVLNERVGLIYGDSITYERAQDILARLQWKGFASCNIVFGIGSYTYQHSTRDSLGFAMKATYAEVNGEARELFKDPITDSGTKKSAKGLLRVEEENGTFVLYDQQTPEQEASGALKTVFLNGTLFNLQTIAEIRNRVGFIKL